MKWNKLVTNLISALFLMTSAFAAGYFTRDLFGRPVADFPLVNQAYRIVKDHAFDGLPPGSAVEYGMIRGMLQSLGDPHTIFLEPVQHELERDNLHGSFGGIGVRLVRSENGELLLYPFPDGPAAQAGIQDADRLLAVDALEVDPGLSIEEITAAIRGPVGSRVRLEILRSPATDPFHLTIRRETVDLPSVTWHLIPENPQIGVIEVNLLAASTPDEVLKAAEDLRGQGASALILDLRDNNGGLLDSGIDTARLFLHEGPIIQQQFRDQDVESFNVEREGPLATVPLAVLINHNTASAAEIVAGAIQRQGRAPLVGLTSFGKDSIQLVFDLEDGSSLHVTSARWWIPDLNPPLRDHGLQPDIHAGESGSGGDPSVQLAVEWLLNH